MDDSAPEDPDWPVMLAAALSGKVTSSLYQPIVDLVRGTTVGYEALTRFDGFVQREPTRWLEAARRQGCAAALESVALTSALRARPDLPANCFLTLNVSPDVLTSDEIRAVWRTQADLSGLVIELTEQTPIESYAALESDLTSLRAAGALIAVDDAGAGYAGLRHLLALRPEVIKLDRELVTDIDLDQAKLALVEMVGIFAARIDAWLLAEGIERLGELDALLSLGVPLAQGYVLGRPEPPWADIDPDFALRIASRAARAVSNTIREFVEIVPIAHSREAAGAHFADDSVRAVEIVDPEGRPHALVTPESVQLGVLEPGLRVNIDTPLPEALARAMTRDDSHRFGPLVCTDNAGRFIGIVRIERLVHAVTRTVQPT